MPTVVKQTKTIAFANQKGGVGKSMSATNLAVAFALLGKRTLLIDFDPQGNSSNNLGIDGDDEKILGKTIYEALMGIIPPTHAIYGILTNLDVIPANLDLAAAENELEKVLRKEYALQRVLKQIEPLAYDYILIDCPPSLGALTINALTACNLVVTPVQPKKHAVKGFIRLTRTLKAITDYDLNPGLRFGGLFITMFDGRRGLDNRIQQELQAIRDHYHLYETTIREATVLAQAEDAEQNIFQFQPASKGAEDYMALAKEILKEEENRG